MSGHFKRSVVSETHRNAVASCTKCSRGNNLNLSLRAAAMTLRTVLLSLQALLAAAEPDDPQDAVVANQVRMCIL